MRKAISSQLSSMTCFSDETMTPTADDLLPYLSRFGGAADLTGLDEDVRLFWQLPVRYLADSLEPARFSRDHPELEFPSYVALVNNGAFNAAIRHDNGAVIAGIFIGVPFIALRVCRLLALLLDKRTGLPSVDAAGRLIVHAEKIRLPLHWELGSNPKQQALDDVLAFEEQTSTHNNELALFMFDLVMRYVAMHESMHFVLGHAHYCQSTLGMEVFEDVAQRRGELPPHVSQTLEFMADRHVIVGLAHDLAEGRIYHEWARDLPADIEIEPAVWYRRMLFVTLSLVSRLWTAHGARKFGDLSQPYPHPYERLCWMLSSLVEQEGEGLAHEAMLALGLTMATLDTNFVTPHRIEPDLELDRRMKDLTGVSRLDEGYDNVRSEARRLRFIYKQHAPFYPGA